jgi:hypothetical protein
MGIINSEWLVKTLVTIAGKAELNKIKKTSLDPERSQRELLQQIVEKSKDTVFGRDHNFGGIKSYEDYAAAVPKRKYNDYDQYFEQMFSGKADVLFPGRPVLYNTSSGTTGKQKLIPISKEFQADLSKFNKTWMYSILEQNPKIFSGKSLSSVGKAIEGYAADGVPIGSISGNSFSTIPGIIKKGYSSIYPLFTIDDYDLKYYAVARNGLEHDISISICPSIANLLRYHQVIMENFDEIVEEIRNGTMRQAALEALSEHDRADVMARIQPNPERADELLALRARYGKDLLPKHYWPNIKVINAWIEGNFAILVDKVKSHFPDSTVIRSFGYQASEGRFGIPLDNSWNYSYLDIRSYFFEFIPACNIDDENPPVLMYHQLELGKRYYIYITNKSGLYRYDMNDILEVVGFYNKTPLLKFIQKGAGVINIIGEKLSEEQVIEAAQTIAAEMGLPLNNYLMFGDYKGFKYQFYVEFAGMPPQADKEAFMHKLDQKLMELNIEYSAKRLSNRLNSPEFIELAPNSRERIKEELVKRNLAKDGQYKDLYLSSKESTREVILAVG